MTRLSFHENSSLHICAQHPYKRVTQMNSPHYLSGRCTGPQLAAFYLFTCSISRPASPRRSAPSQRCPRSKPQRRRGKSPRLFTEAQLLNGCMCISAGEESNRCVPTPGAWSSSCRLITARHKLQNSPDLLGCLEGSPKLSLFFPNPNSLCLSSLPAHACLKATHPVKNTYWFFFF